MLAVPVPAWKKLGLKLKYAKDVAEPSTVPGATTDRTVTPDVLTKNGTTDGGALDGEGPPTKKRKADRGQSLADPPAEKNRTTVLNEATLATERDPKKPKKRVSFSADTKAVADTATTPATGNDGAAPASPTPPKGKSKPTKTKTKKAKGKSTRAPPPPPPVPRSNAALDYLEQYHTSRPSWKFNKNRETWILKHVLSADDIPRAHDVALCRYIHGLQGPAARARLQTSCLASLPGKEDATADDDTETADRERHQHDRSYLGRFRSGLALETAGEAPRDHDYDAWVHAQPRARLVLWSLGMNPEQEAPQAPSGRPTSGRATKRKNRTSVIEYESSSESSSSDSKSESESDSESDNDSELAAAARPARHALDNERDESTSSSSGDSSDSSESD